MIFVRDKGQMCNNILQYGHMYAWGRENGRSTVSMRFAYKYQYFKICNTRYHWFVTYIVAKWAAALKLLPTVTFPFTRQESYAGQETLLRKYKHCIAEGWRVEFPDLFLKYKKEIINLFTFKKHISQYVEDYMNKIDAKESIRLGIHVRRGDYERWMDGKFFFNDLVYASYILKFINSHTDKNVHVFLSSNDPEVTVEKFRKLCNTPYIHKLNRGPAEDLCMLSKCDYIIGPPSTFSLVGSMYNNSKLHWMFSSNPEQLETEGFKLFDELFTKIL